MNISGNEIKLFTGNANPRLAQKIADELHMTLSKANVSKFSDGEIAVDIKESVRGSDVYIVQSTCAPTNDNLMELLIMIDAMKRASAGRITAVMPYYGYARQDRKAKPRDPITAKLVADLLQVAGIDRLLTMDLHANQIQGYFDIPVDHLLGGPILINHITQMNIPDLVVVSPDHGSVNRVRNLAESLNVPMAFVDKRRPKANVSEVMNIVGDVKDKNILLLDDMIDTGGTLVNAANAIREQGGKDIYAVGTHAVLSGPAIERIKNSILKEVIMLDTVYLPPEKAIDKIKIISCAPIFAQAIKKTFENESISVLF